MRVISGTLKSRKILGDNIEGTRPTMDRVKLSLFAIINEKLKDSYCLDLFAGSGQLGIEAISNGAKKVIFCDNNKKCIDIIKKNISNFKIEELSDVYYGDYNNILIKLKDKKFDIIFLDPPYKLEINDDLLEKINEYKLLNESGIVVIEYSNIEPSNHKNYEVLTKRKYGDKYIKIYKCIK